MRKALLTAAACVVLAGCLDIGGTATPEPTPQKVAANIKEREQPPTLETASPDKALKSYWAVRDWRKRLEKQQYKEMQDSDLSISMDEVFAKVTVPAIYERRSYPLETFDREIIEAKVETDTRAIIHAVIKNSTPIPEGAEMSSYERTVREQGNRFRYVLERGQDGWRVAEVWEYDRFHDKKWGKNSPSSSKPRVGTLTIGGQ